MHIKKKERLNKTIKKNPHLQTFRNHHYLSKYAKYACRMQFPKSPALGLVLLTVFISDPDHGTETTFIKLTTNQLDGTANDISGQKGKLDKWSEKKDDIQNIAHRQKSTTKVLSG